MRFILPFCSVAALFVSGCAYDGVIVQKESRPHPLFDSIGVDGMYTFVLRDNRGVLHRQMVTPQVFETYAEGQYFNDQQAPPELNGPAEVKATVATMNPAPTAAHKHVAQTKSSHALKGVADAPPPVEETRSFRASEMKRTSHSMTATLRMEVHHDAEEANNETPHAADEVTAAPESKADESSSAKKTSKSQKAERAEKKSAKPWKMTDPTVEVAPTPPSEGPVASPQPTNNAVPATDDSGRLTVPDHP